LLLHGPALALELIFVCSRVTIRAHGDWSGSGHKMDAVVTGAARRQATRLGEDGRQRGEQLF
jgi:hypothetical protein